VDVPPEARQDPLYIHTEGHNQGRDGCRVPLPWKRGEPNAGFSFAAPWLPMPPGWDSFAVDAEDASATSMLSFYKRALALRRRLAPWLPASIAWRPAPEGVLVYRRERLTVACNFLSRPISLSVRLFANMLAGHTMLYVFGTFVIGLATAGGVLSLISVMPLLAIIAVVALEFLIAFLQAYVFAILTCIYLNDALHLHEHH